MSKTTKKSAWVVQWNGTDKKYLNKKHIITIFDSRIASKKVKEFIENYYIACTYTNYEKAYYSSNKKKNPYPAEYGSINGVRYAGSIICGHNPFINAEYVKNLCIITSKDGSEKITWVKPKINKNT